MSQAIDEIIRHSEQRLAEIIGKPVPINLDAESVEKCPNPRRAVESLESLGGYFVFGILCRAVEKEIIEKFSIREQLAGSLDAVVVKAGGRKFVEESNKVLTITYELHRGPLGVFRTKELASEILTALHLLLLGYKSKVQDLIPTAVEQIRNAIDCEDEFEITVDWDSFEYADNAPEALDHLTRRDGHYSFGMLAKAFREAAEQDGISKEELSNVFKRAVFSRCKGRNPRERRVEFADGTLTIIGVWGVDQGSLRAYELREYLCHQVVLTTLIRISQDGDLDDESKRKRTKFIKRLGDSYAVRNGNWKYLSSILNHDAMYGPDEEDRQGLAELMRSGKVKNEVMISGYPITKINYRGTKQVRIMAFTNKAMYTFPFNYEKGKIDKKHVKRHPYTKYWYLTYGPLRISTGSDPLEDSKNEAEKYGVYYRSFEVTVKQNPVIARVEREARTKLIEVVEKIINLTVGRMEQPPVPKFDEEPHYSVSEYLDFAAASLENSDGASVKFGGGVPDVPLLDVFVALADNFESDMVLGIETENIKRVTLPWLLEKLLKEVRNTEIIIKYREKFDLKEILKSIDEQIEEMNVSNLIDLPAPVPLPGRELMDDLIAAVNEEKESRFLPPIELGKWKLCEGGDAGALASVLTKVRDAIPPEFEIRFPRPDPLPVKRCVEIINNTLGPIDIQNFGLEELGIDLGLSFDYPRTTAGMQRAGLGKLFKSKRKPYYKDLIYYPMDSNDKVINKDIARIHRAIVYSCSYPHWIAKPYRNPMTVEITAFGKFRTKGGGKRNKRMK